MSERVDAVVELARREEQLDKVLTALLRITRTHGGKKCRQIARQTLAEISGYSLGDGPPLIQPGA